MQDNYASHCEWTMNIHCNTVYHTLGTNTLQLHMNIRNKLLDDPASFLQFCTKKMIFAEQTNKNNGILQTARILEQEIYDGKNVSTGKSLRVTYHILHMYVGYHNIQHHIEDIHIHP